MTGLEAGTYHLKAEYVGLAPCDTVVTLPSQHNDTLRMVLPLWYDYILKYDLLAGVVERKYPQGTSQAAPGNTGRTGTKIRTHFFG